MYQAEHYTDDIRDTCNVLAAGEKKGRPVDVREGYLKYAVGEHFVYFTMMVTGSLSFVFCTSRWMRKGIYRNALFADRIDIYSCEAVPWG